MKELKMNWLLKFRTIQLKELARESIRGNDVRKDSFELYKVKIMVLARDDILIVNKNVNKENYNKWENKWPFSWSHRDACIIGQKKLVVQTTRKYNII